MADKKPSTTDLPKQIAELRKTAQEQQRAIRAGTATDTTLATKTRRQIARLLTQQNKESKEGAKE